MERLSLNVPQQVFVVFFAVMWGAIHNVMGRWQAFDTGRLPRDSFAARRFALATAMLSVAPVVVFAFIIGVLLRDDIWEIKGWDTFAFFKILAAALPSLTLLGFYRFWLCAVQLRPRWFYHPTWRLDWSELYPNLRPTRDLEAEAGWPNFRFGLYYLFGPILLPRALAEVPFWCSL